jgi:hypothetical protein
VTCVKGIHEMGNRRPKSKTKASIQGRKSKEVKANVPSATSNVEKKTTAPKTLPAPVSASFSFPFYM